MTDILLKLALALGTVLITALGEELVRLIITKIKNDKAQRILTRITEIVTSAVKATYQEYVESLKDKNIFTKEAQVEALQKAKNKIIEEMTQAMRNYLASTFGDVDTWIDTTIHSTIYDLKN